MDTRTTVGELVAERPGRSRIFERLGIDYCCGGKKPLEEACAAKGIDVRAVLAEMEAVEAGAPGEADLAHVPLGKLIDDIVATHHAYLRRELPRLQTLAFKVRQAHAMNHPEVGS